MGKPRRDLRGLLRVVETTDIQVSRLTDSARAKLWDQLLKIGLVQTLSCCLSMLDNGPDAQIVPVVDEYRSTVLVQLNVMEVMATSSRRVTPASKAVQSGSGSKTRRSRSQSDVKLKTPNKNSKSTSAKLKNGQTLLSWDVGVAVERRSLGKDDGQAGSPTGKKLRAR